MHIAFFSGGRADLWILEPLILRLSEMANVTVVLVHVGASANDEMSHKSAARGNPNVAENFISAKYDAKEVDPSNLFSDTFNYVVSFLKYEDLDLAVYLGDRVEISAVATACHLALVPAIHLHGGESTLGSLDDALRHAISKYSKGHICFSAKAERRLRRMGEDPSSVYQSDSFLWDRLISIDNWDIENLARFLGLDPHRSYVMSCIHPVTTDQTETRKTTRAVLDGIRASKAKQVIVTGPNSDEGADYISDEIEKFRLEVGNEKKVIWIKDLGGNDYLKLLHHSQVLVGNSSSGILEAPIIGVNSISVGSRQVGRAEANTKNLSYLPADSGLVTKLIDTLILDSSKKGPPQMSNLSPAKQAAEWIVNTTFPIEKGFFDGAN